MYAKKNIFFTVAIANLLCAPAFSQEPAATATTNSDYKAEVLRFSPGSLGRDDRQIETSAIQANGEIGYFSNTGKGAGLHLEGVVKKHHLLTQLNDTEIGEATDGKNGERFERGVNLSPGAQFNFDINASQGRFDRSALSGTVGSLYRIRKTSPGSFVTADLNTLTLGAAFKDNRQLRTTEAGATIGLLSASSHLASTLHSDRPCSKQERAAKSAKSGEDCTITNWRVPIEVHGGISLIEGTVGYARSRIGATHTDMGTITPLSGEIGVGVSYGDSKLNLRETLRFNPYTGLPGGSSSGLENELSIGGLPLETRMAWKHLRESSTGNDSSSRHVITNMFTLNMAFERFLGGKDQGSPSPKVEDRVVRKPALAPIAAPLREAAEKPTTPPPTDVQAPTPAEPVQEAEPSGDAATTPSPPDTSTTPSESSASQPAQ